VRPRTNDARRRLAALTSLLLTLPAVTGLGCGSSSGPSSWAGEGRIVYVCCGGGDRVTTVYDVASDTSESVSHGGSSVYFPAWSPDGERIAYMGYEGAQAEIWVMDADGDNVRQLTANLGQDTEPAWHPNGGRIAFASSRDGGSDICVMDADGSDVVNLTQTPWYERSPSWSPDGTRIAYESEQYGSREIHVMDADGSNQMNLSEHPGEDIDPDWSPDGETIVFASDRDGDICTYLYLMDADGRNPRKLTSVTDRSEFDPAWSPDGSRIAHTAYVGIDERISIVDRDGGNLLMLPVEGCTYQISPDWGRSEWSPDGWGRGAAPAP